MTLTCPECGVKDKAVGDPDEHTKGHLGAWFCFNCHAKGNYSIQFETKTASSDAQKD